MNYATGYLGRIRIDKKDSLGRRVIGNPNLIGYSLASKTIISEKVNCCKKLVLLHLVIAW